MKHVLIAIALVACGENRSALELQPSHVDAGFPIEKLPDAAPDAASTNFVVEVVEAQYPKMQCDPRPSFGAVEFARCNEAMKDGRYAVYVCRGGGIASVPVDCVPAMNVPGAQTPPAEAPK